LYESHAEYHIFHRDLWHTGRDCVWKIASVISRYANRGFWDPERVQLLQVTTSFSSRIRCAHDDLCLFYPAGTFNGIYIYKTVLYVYDIVRKLCVCAEISFLHYYLSGRCIVLLRLWLNSFMKQNLWMYLTWELIATAKIKWKPRNVGDYLSGRHYEYSTLQSIHLVYTVEGQQERWKL